MVGYIIDWNPVEICDLWSKAKVTATKTRGQRPNESQKAVIIYMMKSVGEIASKMWPVV